MAGKRENRILVGVPAQLCRHCGVCACMNRAIHRFFLTFSLAFALLAGVPAVVAQTNPAAAAPERAMKGLEEIKQRLSLTDEQIDQLRPIMMNQMEQLKALRDNYAGETSRRSRMKMAREAKGIQKETDKQLKTILSKEQMDEWKKIREEHRDEFKARRKQQGN